MQCLCSYDQRVVVTFHPRSEALTKGKRGDPRHREVSRAKKRSLYVFLQKKHSSHHEYDRPDVKGKSLNQLSY